MERFALLGVSALIVERSAVEIRLLGGVRFDRDHERRWVIVVLLILISIWLLRISWAEAFVQECAIIKIWLAVLDVCQGLEIIEVVNFAKWIILHLILRLWIKLFRRRLLLLVLGIDRQGVEELLDALGRVLVLVVPLVKVVPHFGGLSLVLAVGGALDVGHHALAFQRRSRRNEWVIFPGRRLFASVSSHLYVGRTVEILILLQRHVVISLEHTPGIAEFLQLFDGWGLDFGVASQDFSSWHIFRASVS